MSCNMYFEQIVSCSNGGLIDCRPNTGVKSTCAEQRRNEDVAL